MISFQPDLLIKSSDGRPIAIVEVKSRQNLSRDVATEIRRKGSKQDSPDAPPMYEFPMDKVVTRYSNREPGQRLYEAELELLVLQWLTNLSTKPQEATEEPEKTLARSGFNDSIRRAMVLIEEGL